MPGRRHAHLVATRLTSEQRAVAALAAKLDGVNMTEFVRDAVMRAACVRLRGTKDASGRDADS